MYECQHVWKGNMHVQFLWKSEEASDPLDLELQAPMSHLVGVEAKPRLL